MIATPGMSTTWIIGNRFINNCYGIFTRNSQGNYEDTTAIIMNNIFSDNSYGIGNGDICGCSHVELKHNQFLNNDVGLELIGWYWMVHDNTFNGNTVGLSLEGGYYSATYGNVIYNNNFLNSGTIHARDYTFPDDNAWDNGPEDGGNFWDDWSSNPGYPSGVYIIPPYTHSIDHYPYATLNGWD